MLLLQKKRFTLEFKILSWIISCLISNNLIYSQNILNGDFEINNITTGISPYEGALTISQFNSLVPHCNVFAGQGYYPVGLLSSNSAPPLNELPQNGDWYLGFTAGGPNYTPIELSLELSEPLIAGITYQISFYEGARPQHCPAPLEIGVSTQSNNFGTSIFIGDPPSYDGWTLRVFNFVAPNNGLFITLRGIHSSCQVSSWSWVRIDNICLSIDATCIQLPEFSMPNVFTPNNDGVNDIFKPIKFKGMKQGKMTILNRWGQTVFDTEDILNGWDGLHNNQQCTDGVYYWIVTYIDIFDETKTETGFLTLIR